MLYQPAFILHLSLRSVRFYLMPFDFSLLSLSYLQLFSDACRHADHSSCLILVRCCAASNIKSEPAFLGKVGTLFTHNPLPGPSQHIVPRAPSSFEQNNRAMKDLLRGREKEAHAEKSMLLRAPIHAFLSGVHPIDVDFNSKSVVGGMS
jgi:hypothetical protein